MPDERLSGLAHSNIPKLSGGITCTRDENILVGSQRQAISVIREDDQHRTHVETSNRRTS